MYTIGIDLGGTNIAAGLVDSEGRILQKDSTPTRTQRHPDEIVADMAAICRRLTEAAGLTLADVCHVGVAVPGTADRERGIFTYAPNLPFLNYPLRDKLSALLGGKDILLENDANAAAWAEATVGCAKGTRFSVLITLGTGVGGGAILDGKIHSGFNAIGGEFGHMVIKKDGRRCGCGRKGCWEAYSSATGLIRSTREAMEEWTKAGRKTVLTELAGGDPAAVSGRTAFDGADRGDEASRQVIADYIADLACGIANVINLLQPEVLSIGGGICNQGDALLLPLREQVYKEIYMGDMAPRTDIRIATLGNDAGILGAALLHR